MRVTDQELAAEIMDWKGCYGEERMTRMLFDLQDLRKLCRDLLEGGTELIVLDVGDGTITRRDAIEPIRSYMEGR